ncbi:MAG: hypothetical protein R3226_16925, partial [Halomonas venusta]|nr:hypothetical protein [Halomonas venusta]
ARCKRQRTRGGINAVLTGGLWEAAPLLRVPRFRSFLATSLHRTTLCIDLVARCKRQRTRLTKKPFL